MIRIRMAAAPLALLLAACADRPGALEPAAPQPASLAVLECRATVSSHTVTCGGPAPGAAGRDLIVGGQGVNVQLRSSNVAYDSATSIFSADMTLQNLLGQPVGTVDGTTPAGIRIFFHLLPSVTDGAGQVEVHNPDGTDTFTGTEQPFFLYPELLQPYERTAAKRWEWTVPASVGSFAFQVYVSAPLPNEAGVLKFTQLRGDFAARSLYTVWGTGPGEVWVGGKSTLLYFTGSRWALLPLQTNEGINALHGTGSGDVWAVGSNGFVQHFDGRRWSAVSTGVLETWTAVYAASPTDVVMAGGAYGKVMRWNGAAWTVLDAGNAGRRFSSAWGTGPSDVYLFGGQFNAGTKAYDGLVRHWDGAQWTDTLLPGAFLGAAWASSPADIWVLAGGGRMAHWDGSAWTVSARLSQYSLNAVWGSGPNDVYAAGGGYHAVVGGPSGDAATVMHWNGSAWSEVQTGGTATLRAIWGTSAGNVLAAGDGGSVLRFDGTRWQKLTAGATPEQLTGVFAEAETSLWATACTDGVLHSADGESWAVEAAAGSCMNDVWGADGHVFAVGYTTTGPRAGVVAHRSGGAWSTDTIPGISELNGVWGTSPASVYAVGYAEGDLGAQQMVVLHYDGAAWTRTTLDGGQLLSVWGSGPNDVYAVGPMTVMHYNGSTWSHLGGAFWDVQTDVWGSGPDDVFIAGTQLYHWDGSSWSTFTPVVNFTAHSVWGSGPNDVYAVGTQTLHWNGQHWTYVDVGVSATLWGVSGLSRQQMWAVGERGVVVRGRR